MTKIIIELEENVPIDYLDEWVKDIKRYRYVKNAYVVLEDEEVRK